MSQTMSHVHTYIYVGMATPHPFETSTPRGKGFLVWPGE
jgi:hypothetical protein